MVPYCLAHHDLACGCSIWTVDLAYLLRRSGLSVELTTITLGANPEYASEGFYKEHMEEDGSRVERLFRVCLAMSQSHWNTPLPIAFPTLLLTQRRAAQIWIQGMLGQRVNTELFYMRCRTLVHRVSRSRARAWAAESSRTGCSSAAPL